jgi:hypothetical protein
MVHRGPRPGPGAPITTPRDLLRPCPPAPQPPAAPHCATDTMQTTLNKSALQGKAFGKTFKAGKKAPRVLTVTSVAAPEKVLVTKRSEEVGPDATAPSRGRASARQRAPEGGPIASHPTAPRGGPGRAAPGAPGRESRPTRGSRPVARRQIFNEAKTLLPGGVNSPVRAFKSVGGQPIVFDRVKGAYCWDADNNKYVDYVGSWGPAIVGHADDEVNEALKKQIEKGTSFGAPCELEVRAALVHPGRARAAPARPRPAAARRRLPAGPRDRRAARRSNRGPARARHRRCPSHTPPRPRRTCWPRWSSSACPPWRWCASCPRAPRRACRCCA